jgi:hypothetical protein
MASQKENRKLFILYCSVAGFISAWAISGLLVIVDIISGVPALAGFISGRMDEIGVFVRIRNNMIVKS